jgi:replication-associated recombination protein RarA
MSYVQNSLFDGNRFDVPLADRMRPKRLEEFVGQEHILGRGKLLKKLIESDNITSMILWGPPGVGKTTIATIIAEMTNADFVTFSAVTSGIKEIKDIMKKAEEGKFRGKKRNTPGILIEVIDRPHADPDRCVYVDGGLIRNVVDIRLSVPGNAEHIGFADAVYQYTIPHNG